MRDEANHRILGLIKPTDRPGSRTVDQLLRMLPPEVEVRQAHLDIRRGTHEELEQALQDYEARIADMAREGADLIHPAGVPPLLLGYEGEKRRVGEWERKYGKPIFTNGMSQVNALRALGAKRIVGASYFSGEINRTFRAYLEEARFEVLEMEGMEVDFEHVMGLEPEAIRAFIGGLFRRHDAVDAIYLLGSAWPTLEMIESLEQEFRVPVVHHVPCQYREIQKRFGFRQPVQGCGRLVREMP